MHGIYKLPLVMDPQPEGGYTVTCPVLPELITEGDTIQEAIQNANDALAAIIEAFRDLGRPNVQNSIETDQTEYSRQHGLD